MSHTKIADKHVSIAGRYCDLTARSATGGLGPTEIWGAHVVSVRPAVRGSA